MANLIVEKSPTIKWYSDLHPFFARIESIIREHCWLWTDVDVTCELPVPPNSRDRYLVDGDTLYDFTLNRPQFVWSVLSAFPANADFDPKILDSVPYADGNPDLWHGSPRPQFSDASFEIVCWDSSATLLIGASDNVATPFSLRIRTLVTLILTINRGASGGQHGFYARPRLRRWSMVWFAKFVRSVVAYWFATPWTPPLWQRGFFLVNCFVLRRFLPSERSGVVKTFRCRALSNQMSDHSRLNRSVVRKTTLQDQNDSGMILDATPAERIEMVWQLTLDAWTFLDSNIAKSEFQRHVGRVERRES